jgi:NAD(P)-dependent dehydrogenase (short-subunit alcohol dehydrogenase family)
VNAVCPGYTDTDLVRGAVRRVAGRTGRPVDDIRATFLQANPQGRFLEPEEVASVVVWLCLPGQRSMTGQAIVIDGGETA